MRAFCERCQRAETVDPDGRDEEGVMRYRFRKHPYGRVPHCVEPFTFDAVTAVLNRPCPGSGNRV